MSLASRAYNRLQELYRGVFLRMKQKEAILARGSVSSPCVMEQLEPRLLLSTTFGSQQNITTLADGARSVYAADLNGDGHLDVLSASRWDNTIAWYANDGAGNFTAQTPITTAAAGATEAQPEVGGTQEEFPGKADRDIACSKVG